jgi:hypothetical protein
LSSALPHHSRKTLASSCVPLRRRVRIEEILPAPELPCRGRDFEAAPGIPPRGLPELYKPRYHLLEMSSNLHLTPEEELQFQQLQQIDYWRDHSDVDAFCYAVSCRDNDTSYTLSD